MEAALKAGHEHVVRWQLAQLEHAPHLCEDVLVAAAGAGCRALCEEMLPAAAEGLHKAAPRAAEGGHADLADWLLSHPMCRAWRPDLAVLRCAVYGFDLPALKRLLHPWIASEPEEFLKEFGSYLADVAVASLTPDWHSKFLWLEAAGRRQPGESAGHIFSLAENMAWQPLSKLPDAVQRVALLWEKGLLDAGACLKNAVVHASPPVVRYLRAEGLLVGALEDNTMHLAVQRGDVEVLAELQAAGCAFEARDVRTAARRGHLHVLRWLEGSEAGPAAASALQQALQEAQQGSDLAACGAESGSLEMAEWLWERGCRRWDAKAFAAAARAGGVALLEWLVARGCPMEGDAYVVAAQNGDMATLRCLRRLGCPWGPGYDTLNQAVIANDLSTCSLAVLRWLVEEGCPVDWGQARDRARVRLDCSDGPLGGRDRNGQEMWVDGDAIAVRRWIDSHVQES